MREIKFRAWKKYTKEMLTDTSNFTHDDFSRKGFVFMQYTGLKDKNGKEIYEGDIVKWPENGNYEVVYGYGQNEKTMIGAFCLKGTEMFLHNNDMEIIGNIYSNPELLK